MKKYFIKLTGLTFSVALIGFFVFYFFLNEYFIPAMPFVLVFFFSLSASLHKILLNANKKKTVRFVPVFMLITFLKLMLCLIFMASYAFADRPNAVPFILSFLALYMIFTSFDIIQILPEVRKAKE